MARSPATLAAVAALLLAGCARTLPGGVRCSVSGGREWREYRSRHFTLDTDLDRPKAAAYVAALERYRALELQAWLGEQRELPGRLRVVVPSDEDMFLALAPRHAAGYYLVAALDQPTVVLPPRALSVAPEIIAHELAHYLSGYAFPRQPRWFREGLAEFVQTVANPDPRYAPSAGLVPRLLGRRVERARAVPARELLTWRGELDHREWDRHHLYSWLLYHWLWNERSAQLADFQRRLAAADEPAGAWRAAFPEFDPDSKEAMRRLDEALARHRTNGELTYYRVEAPSDGTFTEVRLPSADVHMLLLEVRDADATQDAEVAEALREDPAQPTAVALDARRTPGTAAARLRAAAAAKPGDYRTWLRLASALQDAGERAEREAALRKALELEPDSALALNELAWMLVTSGRAAEALPLATRAAALRPWKATVLDTLAKVQADTGDCQAALGLQRRAVALLYDPEGTSSIRRTLRDYQARCGEPRPDGTPAPNPAAAGASSQQER